MASTEYQYTITASDVSAPDVSTACDYLARHSGLSKSKIKDAMLKGAVWLTRACQKNKRLRKTTKRLQQGDKLALYFDDNLLKLIPPKPLLVADSNHYSVWYKPAGLLAQGTLYGDHVSLLRQAELHFQMKRKVFLVHRLDREATGLMLVAHNNAIAAKLSQLFKDNSIYKKYRAEVFGRLEVAVGREGGGVTINEPLDGKTATTQCWPLAYHSQKNSTVVDICIKTGRKHQIRRHFAFIGHPILGDPLYGKRNKHTEMKLCAIQLQFTCPVTHKLVVFTLGNTEEIFLVD